MGVLFIVIMALGITVFRATTKTISYSENDNEVYRLPWIMPYTSKNAAYIFVQLGVHMLTVNREDSALKRDFIHYYVKKQFHISSLDFREYYITSLKLQHSKYDLAAYLKKKLKTTEKRIQVVHYLCELAFADGIMMSNERRFINDFCKGIGLTPEQINVVVNGYFARQQEKDKKQKEYDESYKKSSSRFYSKESLKQKYAQVLDIPENSDLKKIKTAYRKLAKKWHPDLMNKHSDAEKKYASDQFLKIQEAYDFFCQD